jgi:hypothetical protein
LTEKQAGASAANHPLTGGVDRCHTGYVSIVDFFRWIPLWRSDLRKAILPSEKIFCGGAADHSIGVLADGQHSNRLDFLISTGM